MAAAEKTVAGGKGGRVSGLQYQMFVAVNQALFIFGVTAPEKKNQMIALAGESADGRVGKSFPALVLVRARRAVTDGERGV